MVAITDPEGAGEVSGLVVGLIEGGAIGAFVIPLPVLGTFIGAVLGGIVGSRAGCFIASGLTKGIAAARYGPDATPKGAPTPAVLTVMPAPAAEATPSATMTTLPRREDPDQLITAIAPEPTPRAEGPLLKGEMPASKVPKATPRKRPSNSRPDTATASEHLNHEDR